MYNYKISMKRSWLFSEGLLPTLSSSIGGIHLDIPISSKWNQCDWQLDET